MSLSNIKKKFEAQRGFTIVELLIVVVVIAILATITVVTYNGVTARANGAAAKTAAQSVLSKAEAYAADGPTKLYPTLPSDLTTASGSTSYAFANAVFALGTGGTDPNFTTPPTTAPSNPNTIIFYRCASAAGLQVAYWDYTATTPAWTTQTTGTCTSPTFKSVGADTP